ncbi:MAG TPA: CBS domain-containing protein [Candidatus Binataceae bacterium]
MSVHDNEDRERILEEERPGPADLESVLFSETLSDASQTPAIVLEADTSLAEAIRQMRENRRGCILLVREGKLAGIFTERDVLMKIAGNAIDLESTPVADYMTSDPETLPADSSVAYALNKMAVEGFRHIPLVDADQSPIGVVSMRDLIEYITGFYQKDVLNLPPHPRATPRSREGA